MSSDRPIDTQKEKLSRIFSEIPLGVWGKIVKNALIGIPGYVFRYARC
jgi:hypothetical protein